MSLSICSVPGTLLSPLHEWAGLIQRRARWLCHTEQIMKIYNLMGKYGIDNSIYIAVFYDTKWVTIGKMLKTYRNEVYSELWLFSFIIDINTIIPVLQMRQLRHTEIPGLVKFSEFGGVEANMRSRPEWLQSPPRGKCSVKTRWLQAGMNTRVGEIWAE